MEKKKLGRLLHAHSIEQTFLLSIFSAWLSSSYYFCALFTSRDKYSFDKGQTIRLNSDECNTKKREKKCCLRQKWRAAMATDKKTIEHNGPKVKIGHKKKTNAIDERKINVTMWWKKLSLERRTCNRWHRTIEKIEVIHLMKQRRKIIWSLIAIQMTFFSVRLARARALFFFALLILEFSESFCQWPIEELHFFYSFNSIWKCLDRSIVSDFDCPINNRQIQWLEWEKKGKIFILRDDSLTVSFVKARKKEKYFLNEKRRIECDDVVDKINKHTTNFKYHFSE